VAVDVRRIALLFEMVGLLIVVNAGFFVAASSSARAASDSITGQVIDSVTRHPLSGICLLFYDTVSAAPREVGATMSGVDGTFSFPALPAHEYDVAIFGPTRPGACSSPPVAVSPPAAWYRDVALSPSLVPPPAATPVAAGTQNLDVCLGPSNAGDGCVSTTADGAITGTVLTTGGVPEPGACIVAFAASNPTGPVGGAITDTQGTYSIGGLPDGTDLTVGFIPPFSGPGGPCDLSMAPPPPPPGALQPVWSGNVFFNLGDPELGPNPYAASLGQGAQIVRTGDVVDACLTSAPASEVPRPPCVAAAIPAVATPEFTG